MVTISYWVNGASGNIQGKLNTLRLRQNGHHFPDDIFLNENAWILIKISFKFVPRCPINNIPILVQIIAWHRPGDKPISEPGTVSLLMHIYITRPQWVNSSVVWDDSNTTYYHSMSANSDLDLCISESDQIFLRYKMHTNICLLGD